MVMLPPTPTFPNRILVFNYEEDSFAIFEQSYTTFANFHTYTDGTWNSAGYPWITDNSTWVSASNQILNPTTIAGNQQGFVFLTSHVGDNTWQGNDFSLMVYDVTAGLVTSPQHNLSVGQFVYVVDLAGVQAPAIFKVLTVVTDDTFTMGGWDGTMYSILPGTYPVGAKMRIIDNFDITSKMYNQVLPNARSVRLGMIDLLIQSVQTNVTTTLPPFQIETFVDDSDLSLTSNVSYFDSYDKSTDVLVWKRNFPQTVGSFYTFRLSHPEAYMNGVDLNNFEPFAEIPFELHSLQMWVQPAGRMMR